MSKNLKSENKKKNSTNSNAFPVKIEKNESQSKRVCSIIDDLYFMFDRCKLDPILETFKSNDLLKEFYMKRIFELMKEYFDNEKEKTIDLISNQNQSLSTTINLQKEELTQLENRNANLELDKIKFEENILKLETEIKTKDSLILNLTTENEIKIEKLSQLEKKIFEMNEDKNNLDLCYEEINEENKSLREKINFLENEIKTSHTNNEEILNYVKNLEEQLDTKEYQLKFFKDNFNLMKTKHEEITDVINNLMKENSNLKINLDEKSLFTEDVMRNSEKFRIEYTKIEEELKLVMDLNEDLKSKIENVYKIKIKALKFKLKEKVQLINIKDKEFKEFVDEKEKLINRLMGNRG